MKKFIFIALLIISVSGVANADGFFDTIISGIGAAANWLIEFTTFFATHKEDFKREYHEYYGKNAKTTGTIDMHFKVDGKGVIVEAVAEESDMDSAFCKKLGKEMRKWKAPKSLYNTEMTLELRFDPSVDLYGVDATVNDK